MIDWSRLDRLLAEIVETGSSPGVAVGCWFRGEKLRTSATGRFTYEPGEPNTTEETVFDLASLTKALCTAPLVWLRIQRGEWSADDRLGRFYPDIEKEPQGLITLGQLLRHVSGYPAVVHLDQMGAHASEGAYHLLKFTTLENPPGYTVRYSDVGYLILGDILQRTSGKTLDQLFGEELLEPFELIAPVFRPNGAGPIFGNGLAPTSMPDGYLRTLQGTVEDENTRFLGGVSGASGLFGNVLQVGRYVCSLRDCWMRAGEVFSRETLGKMWELSPVPQGNTWTYGWDTPSDGRSTTGKYLSLSSVGHLGFTGTSVWYDHARDIIIVVLSNRVNPTRSNIGFNPYRAQIHDTIMETLGFDFPRPRRFG